MMKKLLFVLTFMLTQVLAAMAQDVLYVYRNDGTANGFLIQDIDSICFSKYDADSIARADWQTQVVYTPDSIFRIPLAAVDSLSFLSPAPKFRDDVILLDEKWMPYIEAMDSFSIVVSSEAPADVCATVGHVLVTKYAEPSLPWQFSGRVSQVVQEGNSVRYVCTPVIITDIYEELLAVGKVITQDAAATGRRRAIDGGNGRHFKTVDDFTIEGKVEIDDLTLEVSSNPQIELFYTVQVEKGKLIQSNVRAAVVLDNTVGFNIGVAEEKGEGESLVLRKEKRVLPALQIPMFTGVNAFLEGFYFWEWGGSIDLGIKWNFQNTITADYTWRKDADPVTVWKHTMETKAPEVYASISGNVCAGPGVSVGLALVNRTVASVGLDLKGGLYAEGEVDFSFSPFDLGKTTLYDSFKDSQIAGGIKVSLLPFFTLLNLNSAEDDRFDHEISKQVELFSKYVFPEFDELGYTVDDDCNVTVRTLASRDLLMAARVGFALYDKGHQLVEVSPLADYTPSDEERMEVQHVFSGLVPGREYFCYPVFSLKMAGDYRGTILASPKVDITVEQGETTPFVTTLEPEEVTATTLRLSGVSSVDADEYAIYFRDPMMVGEQRQVVDVDGRNFYFTTQSLSPNVDYEYRAYMRKDGVDYWGEKVTFRLNPEVSVVDIFNVTPTSAVFSGKVRNFNNGIDPGSFYFDYAEQVGYDLDVWSEVEANWAYEDVRMVVAPVDNLKPNTTYFVRLVYSIDGEPMYSPVVQFTTRDKDAPAPVITPQEPTDLTHTSVCLHATVNVDHYDRVGAELYGQFIQGYGDGNNITVNMTDLEIGSTYSYCFVVVIDGIEYRSQPLSSFTTPGLTPGKAVDLGLSVKWASYNVGAEQPQEYGDYYSWGEVETKSENTRENYLYGYGTDDESYQDLGAEISGTEYDVAHVKWGDGWRMPTCAECKELLENCNPLWSRYQGVYGFLFTGPNGNTVFLPAAGIKSISVSKEGEAGYYWSGTYGNGGKYRAYGMDLESYDPYYGYNSRGYGRSIRPVTDE